MNVIELVKTIHGELPRIGYPCVLVRFKECNLACSYCDADLSATPIDLTWQEVYQRVRNFGTEDVLITGGEPLLQKDIDCLLYALDRDGFRVVVETNGSLPIHRGHWPGVTFNMDVKFFDNKAFAQALLNLDNLYDDDCLKFVYSTNEDWAVIEDVLATKMPIDFSATIVFSPATGTPSRVTEFLSLAARYPYDMRMQSQIHKALGAV